MPPIFIAEDDPLMGRMYERAFRLNGYDLKMAFDGEQALSMLLAANPKPSVIILDVMMPKMSGFDVLKKIKEDADLKNIPVILLTNLAGQEDAQKGISMGALMYLVKSEYNPKQIVDTIKKVLETTPAPQGGA
jgi:DNA-binding response OmpR family regulator